MAFNAAQLDAFFTNGPQMGLTGIMRNRLAEEGLATIDDFEDFKTEEITQAIKNLRTPIPAVPGIPAQLDANGNIIVEAVPGIPPVLPSIVPARCSLRLKVASVAYHYYVDTGRTPTAQNMNYTQVLKSFYTEWQAIEQQSKEDKPSVPMLTNKSQTPVRWIESFKDCLYRTYGVRKCPISYIIRDTVEVAPEATQPLQQGCAYSTVSGSVLQEMIDRYSHNHPLYRTDNNAVYSLLDEATRSTIYAPTIKPYSRTKNGRAAWFAIVGSHAGDDKWEQIQKSQMKFLINNKWNGRQYGLDKFTNLHRSAFVSLQEAALHVNFQLPNEHTRVGYLLDNITNSAPDLRAALASIRANTDGMRHNFEAAVAFMLPVCPYAHHSRNRNSNNQGQHAMISSATLQGKGTSGVDLRWHTNAEYSKLSKDQRQELYKWQKSKDGKKALNEHRKKSANKNDNSSMSKKQLRAKLASLQKESDDKAGGNGTDNPSSSDATFTLDEVRAMISATMQAPSSSPTRENKRSQPANDDSTTFKAAALQLQQIIKRSKK